MFFNHDLGESVYKTWSSKQRKDEIAKLVIGYRSGVPIGIVCNMSELIAGSRKRARKLLHEMMTPEERQAAIDKETGGVQILVKEFLQ